ncbi:MAG: VOC family protein [Cyanobacteria bacterium P01_H01_bin.152]
MQLGYTILYVEDVIATVEFYEAAFGLNRKFIHESKLYAEMETGTTVLAFAGNPMAEFNDIAIRPNTLGELPAGFEIAFVTDQPEAKFKTAVEAGAVAVKVPTAQPWGQVVGYVRDLNGCLVEIASPVAPKPADT